VTPVNVLPEPPHDEEKYLYTERHLPYLATVMTASFVAATFSQAWFEYTSRSWPFTVFTVVGLISFGLSLPLSFTGKGFSL
jgi:hypothetical protein